MVVAGSVAPEPKVSSVMLVPSIVLDASPDAGGEDVASSKDADSAPSSVDEEVDEAVDDESDIVSVLDSVVVASSGGAGGDGKEDGGTTTSAEDVDAWSEKNVFAFLTASAIQLNPISVGAGLLRRIVNPCAFFFVTT